MAALIRSVFDPRDFIDANKDVVFRLRPRENAFRYRVAYLCLGLGAVERAAGRWLKVDRPALVSFRRADRAANRGLGRS